MVNQVDLTTSDRIRVVVRCRPRGFSEKSDPTLVLESSTALSVQASPGKPKKYAFDFVAGERCTQDDIFEQAGRPIVDCITAGFHGTLFSYGQTGTGKTWTTTGPVDSALHSASNRGIIPRACEVLLDYRDKKTSEGISTKLRASYLEIYNEKIRDLLGEQKAAASPRHTPSSRTPRGIVLRETKSGEVLVEGGRTWLEVDSTADCLKVLNSGLANRSVAATAMNAESSRSHAIFTMEVVQISEKTKKERVSQLHMVDLAGSERQKTSGASGERLREANEINKSLTSLGNVIQALVETNQRAGKRHVPYRDSKLTFLLKDALGGNSKTCFIATISPAASAISETISTLEFAKRCSSVKTLATINENLTSDVKELQDEVHLLRRQLAEALQARDLAIASKPAPTPLTLRRALSKVPHKIAAQDMTVDIPCESPSAGTGVQRATRTGSGTSSMSDSDGQRSERLQLVASDALSREDAARCALREAQAKRGDLEDLIGRQERTITALEGVLKLRDVELKEIRCGDWTRDSGIRRLRREIELTKVQRDNHPEIARLLLELSKTQSAAATAAAAASRPPPPPARAYDDQLTVLTRELESALVENGVLRELATPRGGSECDLLFRDPPSFSSDAPAATRSASCPGALADGDSDAGDDDPLPEPRTIAYPRVSVNVAPAADARAARPPLRPVPSTRSLQRQESELREGKLNTLLSTLRASVNNLEESIVVSTRSTRSVVLP